MAQQTRSLLLGRKRQQLLLYGYVRAISDHYILDDLLKLLFDFYDDAVYLKIRGKEFEKFLNDYQPGEYLDGEQFVIEGIKFRTRIYPNGDSASPYSRSRGYVQYKIMLDEFPEEAKHIYVSYLLSCQQMGYELRCIKAFRSNMSKDGWRSQKLKLEECRKFNELEFGVYIDLLAVEYNKALYPRMTDYKNENVQLLKRNRFEWNIKEKTMQKLRQCSFGSSVYSNNFDDACWCLIAIPKGAMQRINDDQFSMLLRILRLPYGVSTIEVKYTLKCESTKTERTEKKRFGFTGHHRFYEMYLNDFKEWDKLESLTFCAEIEILAVHDYHCKAIPAEEWRTFGVVDALSR